MLFVFSFLSNACFIESGFLETHELSRLLVEWGCPTDEVVAYLRIFDDNGDGRISFDEFFVSFRPVWRFCFYMIECAQHREDQARKSALESRVNILASKKRS